MRFAPRAASCCSTWVPKPSGEIPFEQERRIRELALWLFVNGEAIYGVRPWHVIREGDIWFTKARDDSALYAIITGEGLETRARKQLVLKSVRATETTEVSVLGHGGELVEYNPEADPTPRLSKRTTNSTSASCAPSDSTTTTAGPIL